MSVKEGQANGTSLTGAFAARFENGLPCSERLSLALLERLNQSRTLRVRIIYLRL
jgi:hypothetical protein